jgi:hypothetical protein
MRPRGDCRCDSGNERGESDRDHAAWLEKISLVHSIGSAAATDSAG